MRERLSSSAQSIAGVGAFLFLLLLGFLLLITATKTRPQGSAEIALEHTTSLHLTIEVAVGKNTTLLEFSHSGDEMVFLSVPHEWIRQEVRNMDIRSLSVDPPELGFSRYHLPPQAGITFKVDHPLPSLLLHNPSHVPLEVALAYVDLERDTVTRRTTLIQEGPLSLWE